MRRTLSLPVPTIGRTVIYAGYTPNATNPGLMLATVIAAPEEPHWNTPVTLEVVSPAGERSVIENVRCSPSPEGTSRRLGYFTWPRFTPNESVLLDEDGDAIEGAEELRAAYAQEKSLGELASGSGAGLGDIDNRTMRDGSTEGTRTGGARPVNTRPYGAEQGNPEAQAGS